jgi:hypothetical protein
MKTNPLTVVTNNPTHPMNKRVQNAIEQGIATIQHLEDEGAIPDVFRLTVYESDADLRVREMPEAFR